MDDTPEFLDPGSEKQRERLTIGLPTPAGPILGQKAQLTGAGNNPTVYRARENRDCVDTSRHNRQQIDRRQVSLPVARLAVLGLLATGPDAGVEAGLFLMKAAAPLPPRGLLARLVASFQLMASGLKKQVV